MLHFSPWPGSNLSSCLPFRAYPPPLSLQVSKKPLRTIPTPPLAKQVILRSQIPEKEGGEGGGGAAQRPEAPSHRKAHPPQEIPRKGGVRERGGGGGGGTQQPKGPFLEEKRPAVAA
jgi:hypothetical protein